MIMQNIGEFTRAVWLKGYTTGKILEELSRRGMQCCPSTLRKAMQSAEPTKRQNLLRRTAWEILDGLPVNPMKRDSLARMCRERGVTMFAVWRHYNSTRPKKYAYQTFSVSVEFPYRPFAFRLRDEAIKCLDEIAPETG